MCKYAFVVLPLLATLPAQAQQPSNVDALAASGAPLLAYNTASQKKDAHGMAAVFTDDAVRIGPQGIDTSRAAIEHTLETTLPDYTPGSGSVLPTGIVLTDGAVMRMGTWSGTYKNAPMKGYWSAMVVRAGDVWKIRQETFNISPQ